MQARLWQMTRASTSPSLLVPLLALLAQGCERAPAMAGANNRGSQSQAPTSAARTRSPQDEAREALQALGPVDPPEAAVARAAPRARAAAPSDPGLENRRRQARAATERAVTAALSSHLDQIKACYQSTSKDGARIKITMRVHRQGYVLDSSVQGVNSDAAGCISRLLGQIKVAGVQTDNTISVTRTVDLRATTTRRVVWSYEVRTGCWYGAPGAAP